MPSVGFVHILLFIEIECKVSSPFTVILNPDKNPLRTSLLLWRGCFAALSMTLSPYCHSEAPENRDDDETPAFCLDALDGMLLPAKAGLSMTLRNLLRQWHRKLHALAGHAQGIFLRCFPTSRQDYRVQHIN